MIPKDDAPEYVVWEAEGSPRLEFNSLVLNAIALETRDGLQALPKRGAEIGGLLLGRRRPDGSFLVEDAELVACEYRYGPSFRLSKHDEQRLRESLKSIESRPGSDLRVVGCYRSNTRENFSLSADDVKLATAAGAHFYLLVQPLNEREQQAGVFMPDNAGVPRGGIRPFPFQKQPAGQAPAGAGEEQAKDTTRSPVFRLGAGAAATGGALGIPEHVAKKMLVAMGLVAVIVASTFVAGSVARFRRERQAAATYLEDGEGPLGLSARRTGQEVLVRWRPDGITVSRALLAIRDGASHNTVPIDREGFSKGAISYTPRTNDVEFHLTVFDGASSATEESVRFIEVPPPALRLPEPAEEEAAPAVSRPAPRTARVETEDDEPVVRRRTPVVRNWVQPATRAAAPQPSAIAAPVEAANSRPSAMPTPPPAPQVEPDAAAKAQAGSASTPEGGSKGSIRRGLGKVGRGLVYVGTFRWLRGKDEPEEQPDGK